MDLLQKGLTDVEFAAEQVLITRQEVRPPLHGFVLATVGISSVTFSTPTNLKHIIRLL